MARFQGKRRLKTLHLDGRIHPDFHGVETALRQQLKSYSGGAGVCVYHRGECVVDLWGGYSDDNDTPWQQDTMAPSFSTTKGVASTLMHIFASRGLLDYDACVAQYWPEFAAHGKDKITIRQVMAHQSGLYHIRQMIDHADRMLDWEHMIKAIEQTAPAHPPGTRTGYHGLTYGFIVGEVLQRISGQKFSDLVQTEIARPMQLDGLYIGAPAREIGRAAQLMFPDTTRKLSRSSFGRHLESLTAGASKLLRSTGIDSDLTSIFDALAPNGISTFEFGSVETLRVAIPAGNGLFTARSLARMYALLANGGELDGVRLLSADTVTQASRRQKTTGKYSVIPFEMAWRLGYHGVITSRGIPADAFGHFGFGGSGAWADPSRQLAVAMIVNSGMGSPFGDTRTARISGAALGCARKRDTAHSGRRQWGSLRAWAD